jgi:outer membrane protein OmpA-like peptidoglycan-associated protein
MDLAVDSSEKNPSSEGGTAGDHVVPEALPVRVAPATQDQFNVVALPIIPIACWRMDDIRFDFGSSFVVPETAKELKTLADLREKHKVQVLGAPDGAAIYPPISIFGHADPVGNDDLNKTLSGRRATAVYALLTRKAELWEDLYSNAQVGDEWGVRSLQMMLLALNFSPGPIDGEAGPQTRNALSKFLQASGLPASGQLDSATRSKLFCQYMDLLCGGNLKLDPVEDFLARNGDQSGKGDRQGCSEFNPVLLFSKQEEDQYGKSKSKNVRNQANAPNRRVVVLLFRPGARVTSARWPCPSVNEGIAACKKRFWSDGEKRRSTHFADQRRLFEDSRDLFACRFYHRLTTGSPCEGALPIFRVRLFDRLGRPVPNAPYSVTLEGQSSVTGTADASGDIIIRNVKRPTSCLLKWSVPRPVEEEPVYSGLQDSDIEEPLDSSLQESDIPDAYE